MPKNFTAATAQGELEPRTRHRQLGNGWHWGVARRLLLAVLVHAAASLPTTAAIPMALWGPAGPPMGPAPAKPTMAALQELDEEAHWQASWALEHPLAKPPPLEPAWELLLELRRRWRHDLVRIRREVLAEVHLLIDDLEEESRTWMAARPSWVRATYSTPDKPAPTRVLAFLELLRRLGYPDLTALTEDMTDGFQMLGEIRPGPGWRGREDGKYQNPIPVADLVATNADYVRRKVHTAKVGEHSEKLLLELIAEKRLGRVIGPTRPPEWLHNVRETAVADHQDVDIVNEPPPGDAFLAASFPVCQTDENGELKVRRAEDWRRSGHNSTVSVADVPTRHFVGSFVDLARRMAPTQGRTRARRHEPIAAPARRKRLGIRPADRRQGLLRPWCCAAVVCQAVRRTPGVHLYARGVRPDHRLRRLRQADAADHCGVHRQHGWPSGADEGLRQGRGGQRHDLGLLDTRRSPRLVRRVRAGAL